MSYLLISSFWQKMWIVNSDSVVQFSGKAQTSEAETYRRNSSERERDWGLERFCVRPWRRGWGRRDADATWWAPGAAPARLSTCVIVAAQVCLHPPLRGERASFRRLVQQPCVRVDPGSSIDASTRRRFWKSRRVDVPDESCPPVAHRLSRLGHDEFREPAFRNSVKLARVCIAVLADATSQRARRRLVAPVLGRRDDVPGEQTSTLVDVNRGNWVSAKGLAVIEIYGQWLTSGVIILNTLPIM